MVTDVFNIGRRVLANVERIDPNTGDKLECPDGRCGNKNRTCPIHAVSVDLCGVEPWPAKDIEFYRGEGMLSADLARKAMAPAVKVARRYGSRTSFEVGFAAEGQPARKRVVTADRDPVTFGRLAEMFATAPDPMLADLMGITPTDPDGEQYKFLAGLFAS